MTRYLTTTCLSFGLLVGLSFPVSVQAGSFAINENSAVDMGRANAGRVSDTSDASVAFGNPALMTGFDTLTVTNVFSHISGDAKFEDGGSTDILGNPLGGDTDGFFDSAVVPALHAVYPVNDRWVVGLAVNAPFGLSSSYDEAAKWPGRYQALDSALTTINVNPSVAVKLSDAVSIAGGISVQYAKAELSSAVDFGAACFGALGAESCSGLGLTPQSTDGKVVIEGDDISVGYNVGIAVTPTPALTIGATYRSSIDHTLDGDADFTVPDRALPLTAGGAFMDTPGTAALPLPGIVEIGASVEASERLTLHANYSRTDWSRLRELRVEYENLAQPDTVEELDYSDASRYSVGADYAVSQDWTLRAGYAFDESPVLDEFPTARIPDNDRQFFAVGAGYSGMAGWQFDVALNHITVDTTRFERLGPARDRVLGDVTADVMIISAGVTKRF